MDEEEIKYFVRIRNTDLDGTKAVHIALTGIKGVGPHTSRTIAMLADVDPRATIGKLDDESVTRIADAVDTYIEQVPNWMVNRPKDVYTGEARHILGTDLTLAVSDDVNRIARCAYRGIRHETGQKVRGQRTKASEGRARRSVSAGREDEEVTEWDIPERITNNMRHPSGGLRRPGLKTKRGLSSITASGTSVRSGKPRAC